MLLAVAFSLAADPSAAWKALYEARFVQIAEGTPENAVRLYEALLDDDSSTDAAPAQFWMGRALFSAGDMEGARRAFERALDDSRYRLEALTLLDATALRLGEIGAVPVRFDFESPEFPGVRFGAGAGRGEAGVQTVSGRGVYGWTTTIRPGEPDRVGLRLKSGSSVDEISFTARSLVAPAVLRVVALDRWGALWASTEVVVDDDDWYDVTLRFADFSPLPEGGGPTRLGSVSELRIEDVTGERSDVRGSHTILVDDLVVD